MKKLLLVAVMLAVVLAGVSAAAEEEGGMKVGLTVQDLSNQVWASRAVALEKVITENGGSFTYLGCDGNVSKQISQIENLVASGVDILMVHPAEDNAINAALQSVQAQGIKVFVYDSDLENGDVRFLLDNYDAGYMIGTTAAEWINEKLDGSAEVAIINWPQIEILLERENGIRDALADLSPDAEIVAAAPALNPSQGMAAIETILQAHPDLQIICAIGGGGAVGANEAVKAAGKLSDTFGIFASDATDGELAAMANNEANRSSIMYTGTPEQSAVIIYGWLEKMYNDEPIDERVYHIFIPVNQDNYEEYM